jgi:hypothetical protein
MLDSIPSQAPITITLHKDTAWLLGALLTAGLWLCLLVALDVGRAVGRRLGWTLDTWK